MLGGVSGFTVARVRSAPETGNTGRPSGAVTAMMAAVASRRLRSRPRRAYSHPSMATTPAAAR